jgi:hypothetical protein
MHMICLYALHAGSTVSDLSRNKAQLFFTLHQRDNTRFRTPTLRESNKSKLEMSSGSTSHKLGSIRGTGLGGTARSVSAPVEFETPGIPSLLPSTWMLATP